MIGTLVVATSGLAVAGSFQGPRLSSVTVAAASAIQLPGQRLVLQANQAIESVKPADVRVNPEVAVTVQSTGATITVKFDTTLRGATDYRVDVAVTGASTGIRSALVYQFTTPDLSVSVLLRDAQRGDRVLQRAVTSTDSVTLIGSPRIQEFALTQDGVAAVVLNDADDGRVVLAHTGQDLQQDVPTPGNGQIRDLRASPTTGLLGFVFSSDDLTDPAAIESQLYLYDPSDPNGLLRPVTGLDGKPVSVIDWRFVPNTGYLVAQAYDESLLLVDAAGSAAPTALGQHAELRGFVPGTTDLVVADPTAASLIDLTSGTTSTLSLPPDRLGPTSYPGKLVAMSPDSYLEVVSNPTGVGDQQEYSVLRVDGSGATELYRSPTDGAVIRDICLSPNGQYVSVELQDPGGTFDGYPNVPSFTSITTYFVDVVSGDVSGGIAGFATSWCN
ncbi:MAG: hypothetical protein ABIR17_00235 [Pseudolysinimonas sp.]|uniref:hypothetical protein n=1 Tax=Pseudolysinimonas sp. TaxID=2680009 RepID=UPI003266F544